VRPSMRGRVMALYSVVFLGSNPIGGPLMGWISGAAGPRAGLLIGAGGAIVGGLVARVAFARMPDTNTGEHRAVQIGHEARLRARAPVSRRRRAREHASSDTRA
jgi:MFS family permease